MHGTGGLIHPPPHPPARLLKYLERDENWPSLMLDKGSSTLCPVSADGLVGVVGSAFGRRKRDSRAAANVHVD